MGSTARPWLWGGLDAVMWLVGADITHRPPPLRGGALLSPSPRGAEPGPVMCPWPWLHFYSGISQLAREEITAEPWRGMSCIYGSFFFFFWEGRHWSFFIGNDGGEDMEGARLPSDPRTSRQFICKAPTTPVTVSVWPRGRRDRTVVLSLRLRASFSF